MQPDSPIEFFCAICGESLTADAEFAGDVISCPTCERSIPVPGCRDWSDPNPTWRPAFSPEILSVEITFVCPGCNDALIADARSSGEPFICPKCEATGEVPGWARAKVRSPDSSESDLVPTVTLSPAEIEFLSGVAGEAPTFR